MGKGWRFHSPQALNGKRIKTMTSSQVKSYGKKFAVAALILLAASIESIVNLMFMGLGA